MKRFTDAEQATLLAAYRDYRGTQVEFCRLHGLSFDTLQNWRLRELETHRSPTGFVEVREVEAQPSRGSLNVEVNGAHFSLSPPPSPELLADLIRALG